MKPSITIITHYYPPETGAAANRIALLAENFMKAGYHTHVLCPLPNYPTGKIFKAYTGKSGKSEIINGVKVTRLWVYATNSPVVWKRFLGMISFSFSLIKYGVFNKLPALVFLQYSPLLVGFFSTLFFKNKQRKLLLNVSDLWPLAGKELGKIKEGIGYSLLEKMEKYCYNKADIVLGQSQEILTHVTAIYPDKPSFLYRNLPNFEPPKPLLNDSSTKKIVYAGLLGVAQGIVELCKAIELPHAWTLDIYGAGAQQEELESFLKTSSKNIVYRGSLSRKQLHQELLWYDLTIIPLITRIYGSVPSKIFEYGRLGLPMLYCGGGEGEDVVATHNLGWVSPSGDFAALNKMLRKIESQKEWPSKNYVQDTCAHIFDSQKQFEGFISVLNQ
jgi:glycosyltransferase involved in cell wall biosynthesis